MSRVEYFDRLAAGYAGKRSPKTMTALHEALAREGRLEGCRVVDVGCGMGIHMAILGERFGCRVAGVDPSAGMLERARESAPDADLRQAAAEELPFSDESFDAVVMTAVVQHIDRPQGLSEVRRVLVPGGRLVIASPDPDAFPRVWLAPLFPSYVGIERRRFPSQHSLERELCSAGFSATRRSSLAVPRRFTREYAVERIRGRHVATFDYMSEDEYRAGLRRAELELPKTVEHTLEWMVVVATR